MAEKTEKPAASHLEALEKEVREYIEKHNVCTIAVSDGNKPSASTVYYVSRGLSIYFESEPESHKIHILRSNPYISLTIDEDYPDWREIKGVQLSGTAKVLDERQAPKLQAMFEAKFPRLSELGGIPAHHVFVEVVPEKIYFLDFTKKFGHKSVYYPKEERSKLQW